MKKKLLMLSLALLTVATVKTANYKKEPTQVTRGETITLPPITKNEKYIVQLYVWNTNTSTFNLLSSPSDIVIDKNKLTIQNDVPQGAHLFNVILQSKDKKTKKLVGQYKIPSKK